MAENNKKISILIITIFLFCLFGILWRELFYSQSTILPSTQLGKTIPSIHLPLIQNEKNFFDSSELLGKVTLINFWASWCNACSLEQNMLLKIKEQYHIPIYGIDYKDNPAAAINFLKENGNPFEVVADDRNGDTVIDFGVYGTPETFVVNKRGQIVYRHIGVINQKTWDEEIYPVIQKYSAES